MICNARIFIDLRLLFYYFQEFYDGDSCDYKSANLTNVVSNLWRWWIQSFQMLLVDFANTLNIWWNSEFDIRTLNFLVELPPCNHWQIRSPNKFVLLACGLVEPKELCGMTFFFWILPKNKNIRTKMNFTSNIKEIMNYRKQNIWSSG